MELIGKDALVAEIESLLDKGKYHDEYDCAYRDGNNGALYALKEKVNSLEVKEVNEVPATVMVNKYGNRFIYSWSGLKEYDDFKEGQEIKILIPNK